MVAFRHWTLEWWKCNTGVAIAGGYMRINKNSKRWGRSPEMLRAGLKDQGEEEVTRT